MNATGHNDEGAGSEVNKFSPSSKLADCLDDVIKVRGRAFLICHAARKLDCINDDHYTNNMVPTLLILAVCRKHVIYEPLVHYESLVAH